MAIGGQDIARLARKLVWIIVLSVGASIIFTLPLLGFNVYAASIDRAPVRAHVEQAIANGELPFVNHLRTDTVLGTHQYNDCLILAMLVDDRTPAIERGLSPLTEPWPEDRPDTNKTMCETLSDFMDGSHVPAVDEKESYHRYLHGHTALAGVLLAMAPLALIRTSFSVVMCLAVLACIAASVRKAAINTEQAALVRSLDMGVAGIGLLFFFGLPYFSPSLSHFPSDLLLVAYLFCVLAFDMSRWSTIQIALFHSGFGVLTAYYEFLTGGIPLGLCFIFLGFAAYGTGSADRDALVRAFGAAVAFLTAVVVAFVVKLGITVAIFGNDVFTSFIERLAYRTVGNDTNGASYPWNAAWGVLKGAYDLGAGWQALGVVLLLATGTMFIASLVRLWRDRKVTAPTSRELLLITSALSVFLWWAVFSQHTAQHFFFMARIGVGPIVASTLLAMTVFHAPLLAFLRAKLAPMAAGSTPQQDRTQ